MSTSYILGTVLSTKNTVLYETKSLSSPSLHSSRREKENTSTYVIASSNKCCEENEAETGFREWPVEGWGSILERMVRDNTWADTWTSEEPSQAKTRKRAPQAKERVRMKILRWEPVWHIWRTGELKQDWRFGRKATPSGFIFIIWLCVKNI